MKLKVLIHRQTKEEPQMGTLRAYVIQNGQRGENLLPRRQITAVETAKNEATAELRRKLRAPVTIDFEVDE